jgi:hypothetical protein
MTLLNRSFYVAVLAIGIYCVAKAALILLNQWIERSERRESFREPAQFVVRVVFGAFGTMIVLENLGISLTAVWTKHTTASKSNFLMFGSSCLCFSAPYHFLQGFGVPGPLHRNL